MLVIDAGAPKRGLPPGNKFGCCWKPDVEGLLTEIPSEPEVSSFLGWRDQGLGIHCLTLGNLIERLCFPLVMSHTLLWNCAYYWKTLSVQLLVLLFVES